MMHDVHADSVHRPGLVVGIDASRNRSGGARAHIIGLLTAREPAEYGIAKVHIWSYPELLAQLPDRDWLIKHSPVELVRSLPRQLWWQRFRLGPALRSVGCDVLLSTDAGTVCRFSPSVVMSRDMLSFEAGEMDRYGLSLAWLRLWVLRHIQVASLRQAAAALFLTRYAARVIQHFTGPLRNATVIPHGIGENFRWRGVAKSVRGDGGLKCVYVSNADRYKHQWHVIEGVRLAREAGWDLQLELVGAAMGPSSQIVAEAVRRCDPAGTFVRLTPAVAHANVPAFLAEADVFIFASSCENMPNTLVEAMASRLPIACSERGPMPEILQHAGEYFDPESPRSIAECLIRLARSSELRVSKSMAAMELAAQYSWERCASETWALLVDTGSNAQCSRAPSRAAGSSPS